MTRINKWLSEMGICSRKQADRLVMQGKVWVNNQVATLGMSVLETDVVHVNGKQVIEKPQPVFLLYHKPVGVVCTHDSTVENSLEQVIDYPERVFAVGRLDKQSEGLLLLTNQGDSVNKIMRSEHHHEKVYRVWVDSPITEAFIKKMASGVHILNTITLPCKVIKVAEFFFEITLTQGLNLQIRRMAKALGYRVTRLQRIKIMQFDLQGIEKGQIRTLNRSEMRELELVLSENHHNIRHE